MQKYINLFLNLYNILQSFVDSLQKNDQYGCIHIVREIRKDYQYKIVFNAKIIPKVYMGEVLPKEHKTPNSWSTALGTCW